jgi:hypothetical protein
VKGLEPSTTEATTRCSTMLSYTHHPRDFNPPAPNQLSRPATALLARQKGLEPLTRGLEGRCSVHLSYWRDRGEPI